MEPESKRVKYQCGKCQQFFDRIERLQNHQKHCDVCNLTFCGVKEYNKHQRTLHLVGVNKCGRCCRIFPSRKDLSLHQQSLVFKNCQYCDKKFCSAKDFNNHQLTEHDIDVKKCIRCLKTFAHLSDRERHQENSTHYDCNYCEKKFCHLKDLNNHLQEAHDVDVKKCIHCLKTFTSSFDRERHEKAAKHHDCNLCENKFCHLKDLDNHLLEVHDVDVKKCMRCLKTFDSSIDRQRHEKVAEHHDCDFCENKFCNERDYGLHQISVHHVNPRKCKICSKEYKTIRALRKHRIDAAPEQCDECNLVFCHKRDMNLHKMSTHTGGGCEPDTELTNILEQPICSATGFEKDSDYLEVINEHERIIKDHVKEKKNIYANINKEITPQFTYNDLHDLVKNEVYKRGKVCRINIGFGIMLKNKLTNAYRYYYVSTNHLLFKQAFTISTRDDINKFIKELYDINVCETSYLTRPDSSWLVAGLPNILIKLSLLNVVFG